VGVHYDFGSYSTDSIEVTPRITSVVRILESLKDEFSLDTNRFYVTGLSMGGYGTWDMITRWPEMFAAAVPLCGAGDPSKAELIKDIGMWIFHGNNDDYVPVEGSREMFAALEAVESTEAIYTEYDGADHFIWNQVCVEEELIDWLFAYEIERPVAISLPFLQSMHKLLNPEYFIRYNIQGKKLGKKPEPEISLEIRVGPR
jgi:predicted peptidase